MAASPSGYASMPYIIAGVVLALIAALFSLGLLFLRPELDALLLITAITGVFGTMFTGISAFIKSQETHLVVNSQLSAWKAEFSRMSRAEGIIAGTQEEQTRVAEQLRIKLDSASVVPAFVVAPAPIPTSVSVPSLKSEIPIPVTVINPAEEPVITVDAEKAVGKAKAKKES